ncbi:UDP-N-acetylglucosamine--N-acetylmuramyl-(pentapeptide) pyrophosphoryl-undecaprenol N-acetylglucosamine transferase [Candidatus Berkelbacteria bacterium]|nr:UDP-N-acetylglucosamine--N-acetylmuramyl-(pentapeptide) pyrophosphoryl-undecaprenol N-acetylglucosamine transferase [Candidatus Berkelbacteria bacterium]
MPSARTIVVAGGGTAGHVYPVFEIVRALWAIDPALEIAYIGDARGPERELLQQAQLAKPVAFYGITADKLRRYWDWRIFLLPFAVCAGTIQALSHLLALQPVAVLCKGGYVGVPVAIAAWLLRIPIVLHETDMVMGLANRMIAPFARKIAVSFPRPNLGTGSIREKLVYTGNPVRPEFHTPVRARAAGRPRLAITCGSQGSHAVNELVRAILSQLLVRYHVTHVTGKADFAALSAATQHREYEPVAYATDMPAVLRDADLVVSRSGGTIFELAALGKPAILIPHPATGSDHQRVNARFLAERDAAVYLDQVGLTPERLLETITQLMRDSTRRGTLAANIKQFSRPDAAARVAELILSVARKS